MPISGTTRQSGWTVDKYRRLRRNQRQRATGGGSECRTEPQTCSAANKKRISRKRGHPAALIGYWCLLRRLALLPVLGDSFLISLRSPFQSRDCAFDHVENIDSRSLLRRTKHAAPPLTPTEVEDRCCWNRFVNPPCPSSDIGNGGDPRYAAKPNPATSSKSCSKSARGARHMVLYVSKKGRMFFAIAARF